MKAILWVCVLLTWNSVAHAWGDDGHRITAQIANELLSDSAKEEIRRLVGTDDLVSIATWLDDEREMLNQRIPGSSRWHYENREACSDEIGARACPQGQCITKQLARSSAQLQNAKATDAQRADALRIVVHLVGDLHQPLHLSDNFDRGGNDTWVLMPGELEPRRLHEAWDTRFIKLNLGRQRTTKSKKYAQLLAHRFAGQTRDWQIGSIEQWANETHLLGKKIYRLPGFSCKNAAPNEKSTPINLPSEYVESARVIVDVQLSKAGVRLAMMLNELFAARTH